jgi:hypothetical protein
VGWVIAPLRKLVLTGNPHLFGFKTNWDIAGAFVMCAALAVSPLDFLNVSGDINQNVSGPFCHFEFFRL